LVRDGKNKTTWSEFSTDSHMNTNIGHRGLLIRGRNHGIEADVQGNGHWQQRHHYNWRAQTRACKTRDQANRTRSQAINGSCKLTTASENKFFPMPLLKLFSFFCILQADADGNGTIDYDEFITATMHMNRMNKEDHLYTAFQYFDKDNSG